MKKIYKTWKLPAPKQGEEFEWRKVVRVGRLVPFGYRQDPDDCDILLPIPKELDLLEEAKKYLRQYSYRDVAAWLSEQSDRYISHVGLMKRVKSEQKRKREAANQRYLAEKYKAALEKAEKLEAERLGGKGIKSNSATV
tara:strand:- start:191 stop:607 length:417 start_codon:yes stop_codon:yes gene_type:complete